MSARIEPKPLFGLAEICTSSFSTGCGTRCFVTGSLPYTNGCRPSHSPRLAAAACPRTIWCTIVLRRRRSISARMSAVNSSSSLPKSTSPESVWSLVPVSRNVCLRTAQGISSKRLRRSCSVTSTASAAPSDRRSTIWSRPGRLALLPLMRSTHTPTSSQPRRAACWRSAVSWLASEYLWRSSSVEMRQ